MVGALDTIAIPKVATRSYPICKLPVCDLNLPCFQDLPLFTCEPCFGRGMEGGSSVARVRSVLDSTFRLKSLVLVT